MGRRALVLCVLLIASCAPNEITSDWHRLEPRPQAIDFSLQQLDADMASLSDFRGKIVVMEFWATWCGPCRFSLPSLEVIYKRFKDRGVMVLLLNQDEPPDKVRAWANHKFTAPILLDEGTAVAARYGVRGIPRLFIVDQEGKIVYAHEGYGGGLERNLSLILEQLLSPAQGDHG